MEVQDSVTIKPKIHDLSAFKQIMESRSHPLDMVREALSNMMAPEVGADTISVQHFSHPEYNASFIFKDDGVGMSYTGSDENPGRLDRFIGLAFSRAAGLSADYWGWKGLGSKLMLNCHKLMIETWTGQDGEAVHALTVLNPRTSLLAVPPQAPEYYLTRRKPTGADTRGTRIEVLGYDGGQVLYNFASMERYLYWNTALGLTRPMPRLPRVYCKVQTEEKLLEVGYPYITKHTGDDAWRTVVIDPPIQKIESVRTEQGSINVEVTLKGGFTLETGRFGLSPHRYNTGLRLSVKGIPYFQLPFYEYKGQKFQQYKDLSSFVVECDAIESKLNLDRSNISNQMGQDLVVSAFKRLTVRCFDDFAGSDDYKRFEHNHTREDERTKADAVRKRQRSLSSPSQQYVCLPKDDGSVRVIHRVPDRSEMDTLAVFWKLEAMGVLPFAKFITWEHTKRDGIDVIASYQIDDESATENFVPVEFEFQFENYLTHGHNPKQTKCIVCWTIGNENSLRRRNAYSFFYDVDDVSIPVFAIEKFPCIVMRTFGDIDE